MVCGVMQRWGSRAEVRVASFSHLGQQPACCDLERNASGMIMVSWGGGLDGWDDRND